MSAGPAPVTPERIMQLSWGYSAPLMIEAAVRNRIFDVLDGGPKTAVEVASLSGASLRGVRIVMNALAALQLLTKGADGRCELAPDAAAFLVSGKPAYLGALSLRTSTQSIPTWLQLSDVVRTGKPAAGVEEEGAGQEFFAQFVEALFPLNYRPAVGLADALNVAASEKPVPVLDLATGSGVWGIALAQKSPQVTVTAVDWPGVLDITRRTAARFGLADRFSFLGGDLWSVDFGSGYHIATLGHILHMAGESRSRTLLRKTFESLAPGGTVAIAEFLVDDARTGPAMGLIFAVNMLVATEEGDTYSFNEIAGWLRDAGFVNPRTVDSPGPSPLILADRPS